MTAEPQPRRDRHEPEAGNVAVLVALLLGVFALVAALSLDAGAGWAMQRALITEVDAAALAGAQRLADHRQPCDPDIDGEEGLVGGLLPDALQVVRSTLTANGGQNTSENAPTITCRSGVATVQVQTSRRAARFFTDDGLVARASATARGVPRVGGRVVPLTLCATAGPFGESLITLTYDDGSCGGAGAWGWFGGTDRDTIATRLDDDDLEDILEIVPGDSPTCTVAGDDGPGGWCAGLQVAGNEAGPPLLAPLEDFECPEETAPVECEDLLTVLLHDEVDVEDEAAAFRPGGFVDVVIREVNADGGPANATLTLESFGDSRRGADAVMTADPQAFLCNVEDGPSKNRCTEPLP